MADEKQTSNEAKQKEGSLSQREAVYLAIANHLKNKGIAVKKKQAVKEILDEEHLQAIYRDLTRGFKAGKIALKSNPSNQKKLEDQKLMQNYLAGLVSNWLRRDPRLNGEEDFSS